MKITYEPGDIVEIEDNSDAGSMSGCTVKLMLKLNDKGMWRVEYIDGPGYPGHKYGNVPEIYMKPC
jgi:hypothetical protein